MIFTVLIKTRKTLITNSGIILVNFCSLKSGRGKGVVGGRGYLL